MIWQRFVMVIVVVIGLVSCGSDSSTSPQMDSEPEPVITYMIADLSKQWTGVASNQNVSFNMSVLANASGKVSGSGVDSQWQIDDAGTVSGGGSFNGRDTVTTSVSEDGFSFSVVYKKI